MPVKYYIIAGLVSVAVGTIIALAFSMNGTGGLRAAVTLSGVYAVADPDGYQVVCFINKASGAIDCLAKTAM